MSFADWKKRTTAFERYLPSGHHAMAELVAQAAYKAGERDGRKQAEAVAEQAIRLHEIVRCEMTTEETTTDFAAPRSTDGLERTSAKALLIKLAAQMATRQGMPSPDDWPGWGPRVPQKLWRAARDKCDKAQDQCGDWAYELRKIADAL